MLGQIEILLAFAAVMAGISLVITVCNQVASAILNLRGLSLRWGLAAAFKNLFPLMNERPKVPIGTKAFGDYIAKAVLVHPLISDSTLPSGRLDYWRLASAIRAQELQRILTVMGSPEKGNTPDTQTWTNDDAVSWLSRRVTLMDDWFGVTMDRVSQRFTFHMRILTVIFASAIAFLGHVDSISLYRGLSADVKLRNGLLTNIQAIQTAAEQLQKSPGQADVPSVDEINSSLNTINSTALVSVAQTLRSPLSHASKDATRRGELITVILLSLGAPFWFHQLKNLSNLRSIVAAKEQKEREESRASPAAAKPSRQAIGSSAERNEGEVL